MTEKLSVLCKPVSKNFHNVQPKKTNPLSLNLVFKLFLSFEIRTLILGQLDKDS